MIVGQAGNCGFQFSRRIDGKSALFDSINMLEMCVQVGGFVPYPV
jgi:hypothetical protein